MNLAYKKQILESELWNNPENATDGNFKGQYTYAETTYPNYFTLDLEKGFDISLIRFLLFDQNPRNYKYRLLTSVDLNSWTVHFDITGNSWQNFEFNQKIKVRYIRIHCLWNSKNEGFHIAEIEAYENKISIDPKEEIYLINNSTTVIEISDGLPITRKLQPLVKTIKEIPDKFPGLDKEYFTNISTELEQGIYDVQKVEREWLLSDDK